MHASDPNLCITQFTQDSARGRGPRHQVQVLDDEQRSKNAGSCEQDHSPTETTGEQLRRIPVPHGSYFCLKCTAGTARNRSAAPSAVMSRCGMPSISKPTMNFFTVAERSNGG